MEDNLRLEAKEILLTQALAELYIKLLQEDPKLEGIKKEYRKELRQVLSLFRDVLQFRKELYDE